MSEIKGFETVPNPQRQRESVYLLADVIVQHHQ